MVTVATSFVFYEIPTPATNGVITVFTTDHNYVANSLQVFIDGILRSKTVYFSETTSTTFTMVSAPDSNESLRVTYIRL